MERATLSIYLFLIVGAIIIASYVYAIGNTIAIGLSAALSF